MTRYIATAAILVIGCLNLSANGAETDREPPVFQVNEGDYVYFRLVSATLVSPDGSRQPSHHIEVTEWTLAGGRVGAERVIGTIPTSHIGSDGTVRESDSSEFLIQFSPRKTYTFDIRQTNMMGRRGEILGRVDISMNALGTLQESINVSPGNFRQWTLTVRGTAAEGGAKYNSEIVLAFAGVSRHYELKSIDIPSNSPIRSTQPHPPLLRVYIDENGKPLPNNPMRAHAKAWSLDFPSGKSNVWEVREGVGASYLIRLRCANTIFTEVHLLDRRDIRAEDFRLNDGIIMEEMSRNQLESRAVRFRFAPVAIP